ncbi:MAG: DUF6390 family protein [Candidatus Micrarchaeota archaeon]|nr:DUF6390 family protein [Candidatus Micrarchaeota archaeon]
MEGTEISARFGLPPNSKKYCGSSGFAGTFSAYLKRKDPANLLALKHALTHFHAHYSYLKLIAKCSSTWRDGGAGLRRIASANGKKPFDPQVTEALWLGNRLLAKVKKTELQRLMLHDFCGKGMLSAKRAEMLAAAMPDGFVPHHSFHVLYIHSITDVVPPTVSTSDNCRVSWGKVITTEKNAVIVKTQKLVRVKGKLALLPAVKKWKTSCAGIMLLPSVKRGDLVAAHWGVAVMKLTKKQSGALEKATLQNIRAANRGE